MSRPVLRTCAILFAACALVSAHSSSISNKELYKTVVNGEKSFSRKLQLDSPIEKWVRVYAFDCIGSAAVIKGVIVHPGAGPISLYPDRPGKPMSTGTKPPGIYFVDKKELPFIPMHYVGKQLMLPLTLNARDGSILGGWDWAPSDEEQRGKNTYFVNCKNSHVGH